MAGHREETTREARGAREESRKTSGAYALVIRDITWHWPHSVDGTSDSYFPVDDSSSYAYPPIDATSSTYLPRFDTSSAYLNPNGASSTNFPTVTTTNYSGTRSRFNSRAFSECFT